MLFILRQSKKLLQEIYLVFSMMNLIHWNKNYVIDLRFFQHLIV